MCGIVGYVGKKNAKNIILDGLYRLEYRGYDSAGICLYDTNSNNYSIIKDEGRVAHLDHLVPSSFLSNIGIGHTRWATHGKPSQTNSHPHMSIEHRFIMVHNGVIDNYKELIYEYLDQERLVSETDTEVVVSLIEHFSKQMSVSLAIRKTLTLLEGSYACAIVDREQPEVIYAAKNKSPLLLGKGKDGYTIGSDLMALVDTSETYYVIDDLTYIEIYEDHFSSYDLVGNEIPLEAHKMDLDFIDVDAGSYKHFMLKEIDEQPVVIRRILEAYTDNLSISINPRVTDLFKDIDRIYIIAAGTSMNAGFVGKQLFEKLANIPTEVHIASEFAYNPPLISSNPLCIFISQSGETADLRASLVYIKQHGYKSLTITNVKSSTLAREADEFVELFAGPEISVASTKAYTAQIAVLSLLAYHLNKHDFDLISELNKVALSMENLISKKEYIESLVKEKITKRNCFYIGRGVDYFSSLEAALKLKEISYVQTEGFAAGELKHGTIALIEEGTPVIAIISDRSVSSHTRSNLQEVISRGANPMVISTQAVHKEDDELVVGDVYYLLAPMLTIIPAQLIAYYAALQRGYDIDKPRNLAKSVTVE
jgi:glucosamine--fructose-6-phosphate aminotransferase (isomerizing)